MHNFADLDNNLGSIDFSFSFLVKCTVPPVLVDIGYEKVQGTEVLAVISLGGLNLKLLRNTLVIKFSSRISLD